MKGVIVAAGYGSRFLPITKTMPKEMLPLFDRPMLDFILDEFEEAGIKDVVIITSRRKKVMEDYLDREVELEASLTKARKDELLKLIRPRDMNFTFIRQREMKGTGHALLMTRSIIGDEAFVVAYPDDLILGTPGVTKKMMDIYENTGKSVLAVRKEMNDVTRFGVIRPVEKDGVTYVREIVEKPSASEAPSNLVSIGRYLFSNEFLPLLADYYSKFSGEGEFYHIDTIANLGRNENVIAYEIEGTMLDTGEPLSYFRSLLTYANTRPEGKKILSDFYNEEFKK